VGLDDRARFPAHLSLGGVLDPTWLDLYSEAMRAVTGRSQPRDFIDARSELGGPADQAGTTIERIDPAWITAIARTDDAQIDAIAGRWIDLVEEEIGELPREEKPWDPEARGRHRGLRPARGPVLGRAARLVARMTSFDERAREWDNEEHIATATAVAKAIRSAVPLAPTTKALEIGAGTGLLGLALVEDLGELVLSDPSAGMRDVASEKVRQRGLTNVRVEEPRPPRRAAAGAAALRPRHLTADAPPRQGHGRPPPGDEPGARPGRPDRDGRPRRGGRHVP